MTRIMGTLREEDLYKFVIIFPSVLLRMRNVLDKVVEKERFMFNNFFSENPAGYEIMLKMFTPQMKVYIIRRMRPACWTGKATDTQIM
jgi:hypothetical protein